MRVSGAIFKHSNAEEKKIKSIQFGLLSPSAIKEMAVCEITQTRSFDDKGTPIDGGINDLRMGSTDKAFKCKTCHCQNNDDCPGHFGYIKLAEPVFHIGFIADCLKILKCVCYHCHQILIDDYDKYVELLKKTQMETFNEMKFYAPGDLVKVRHNIDFVPVM